MDAWDPDVTFLFNGWIPVARVLFITVLGYVVLLTLLRVSGQRTLAQMTPLDLIITVTIGSAFGRVITAREVALVEVVAAFGALVLIQWLVAVVWARTPRLREMLTPAPALLFYDGEVVRSQLRRTRLREADLASAARQEGLGSLADVRAILLEPNGSLSVLPAQQYGDGTTIASVRSDPRST